MARDYMAAYNEWLKNPAFDSATRAELAAIKDDEKEIEDRFYRDLEFGTAGLRGVLGAGTNRMNRYTVGAATQGLANYILKLDKPELCKRGVVIAHDSRRMSPEFALQTALTLAGCGIKAYLFEGLRPTPELSYAVRRLGCVAGVVITASHNPPEYNGYKVYWEDGAQIPYPTDEAIIAEVAKVTDFASIKPAVQESAVSAGLLVMIGKEIDDGFNAAVLETRVHPEIAETMGDEIKVVYTPLHGTGNIAVRRVLREAGYSKVFVVTEQEEPDGEFPTVDYPNPEDKKVFALAESLLKKEGADLAIATDPDADRVGVAVAHKGELVYMTGNQSGALLVDYVLTGRAERGTIPKNPAVVTTIVSTKLTHDICLKNNVAVFDVLTGFKHICGEVRKWEENPDNSYNYVFGFEESYGCLPGTYCRDKDAIAASLLIVEMAAYYKAKGMTLIDALNAVYARYGYFSEATKSVDYKGISGAADMKRIMAKLRENPPKAVGEIAVFEFADFLTQTKLRDGITTPTGLPVSDVLYFALSDDSWVCVRPSGTEPKIKLYCGVKSHSSTQAAQKLAALCEDAAKLVE